MPCGADLPTLPTLLTLPTLPTLIFAGFGSPGACQSLGKGLNSQEFYEDLMVMSKSSGLKDARIDMYMTHTHTHAHIHVYNHMHVLIKMRWQWRERERERVILAAFGSASCLSQYDSYRNCHGTSAARACSVGGEGQCAVVQAPAAAVSSF